jgi:hypothetical protein
MISTAVRAAAILLGVSLLSSASIRAAEKTPAVPADPNRTIVGEVQHVDVARSLVTIKESANASNSPAKAKPETVIVSVSPATQIIRGKKTIGIADLKRQDRVLARYVITASGLRAVSIKAADLATANPAGP